MTLVLGLTGSIGTGKSTAAAFFKQRGYPVIDADWGARLIVEPGTVGLKKIQAAFGADITYANGVLKRDKLGTLIFQDEPSRRKLDAIMQPLIRDWLITEKKRLIADAPKLIVMDIPLLFEHHLQDLVDMIMVIYVNEDTQIQRLMARNDLNEEAAMDRVFSQMRIDQKADLADIVMDNSEDIAYLNRQLEAWCLFNGF